MFKRYLLTYEEANLIVEKYDNFQFYKTVHFINGFRIELFTYRLLSAKDMEMPLIDMPHIKGNELRGMTFVFNKDGSIYKRYLLLDKFYNLNQTENTLYDKVKDKEIKSVMVKEDGSLATFIYLPDKTIVSKTIGGFSNDQTVLIDELYSKNKDLQIFVKYCLDNELIPIFELVSPKNRIVIEYKFTDLVLLRIRDNISGDYIPLVDVLSKFDNLDITVGKFVDFTLDELIEFSKDNKEIEGWVVEFVDGSMIKIKTVDYCDKHGLYTEDIWREDTIIKHIVDNTIDDIISAAKDHKEALDNIDLISKKVNLFIKNKINEVEDLLSNYNGSKKDFALAYRKDKNFPFAISVIDGFDLLESIKIYIKKITFRLGNAREWLNKITI